MEETKTLYSGMAVGGPLDGTIVEGRYPEGIIFVSKPENKAWVYDFYAERQEFCARPVGYDAFWDEMSPEQKMTVIVDTTLSGVDPTRELNKEKLLDAPGDGWEVRALPEEGDF